MWKSFASRDLGTAALVSAQTRTRSSEDTLDRVERAETHADHELKHNLNFDVHTGWHHYFTTDVYNCIELANLLCFVLTFALRLAMQSEFDRTLRKTMESGNVEGRFDEPIRLRDLILHYDRTSAINAILSIMKAFKYVRFSATLTLPVDIAAASCM